jgi:glycosyltransferase involved in cell wall biosynthesis
MRILWIGHNLGYPPVRGVLLRDYNLLRQAASQCEVHVVAFDQPAARPSNVSAQDCADALRQFCADVEYIPLASGVYESQKYWLALRGLVSRNPYDINWLASSRMAHLVQSKLESIEFDTVHFDTLGLAQYRRFANGVGTVLNHHNIESSMMDRRRENEPNRLLRQYWRWEAEKLRSAEQKYCPQFGINMVVSSDDADSLVNLAPGLETRVVANGVDTEYFTPRSDPGGKTLLFCGGLDWYPNGEAMAYFFDAIWPRLSQLMPDVRILVVGRKPPQWLQKLGETDSRVTVTGFVDDVRPYFREATAYFCPIRVGGGTRLKILDALAMGMPLVATSFACSGLPIQHDRHALLADTTESFIDEVIKILTGPELRKRLAAQGRELVCNQYSWSVVGENLLRAYQDAALYAKQEARASVVGGGA